MHKKVANILGFCSFMPQLSEITRTKIFIHLHQIFYSIWVVPNVSQLGDLVCILADVYVRYLTVHTFEEGVVAALCKVRFYFLELMAYHAGASSKSLYFTEC